MATCGKHTISQSVGHFRHGCHLEIKGEALGKRGGGWPSSPTLPPLGEGSFPLPLGEGLGVRAMDKITV